MLYALFHRPLLCHFPLRFHHARNELVVNEATKPDVIDLHLEFMMGLSLWWNHPHTKDFPGALKHTLCQLLVLNWRSNRSALHFVFHEPVPVL